MWLSEKTKAIKIPEKVKRVRLFSENKTVRMLRRIPTVLLFFKEQKMERYTMKSFNPQDYMTIVKEMEDGMIIRIVRDRDGYDEVTTDFISRDLFESCVRTGYLTRVASLMETAAIA
jgi:hypothetical protein